MPPTPPYLIFGFDVDRANPAAGAIIHDAYMHLPPIPGLGSLGVDGVFLLPVRPSWAYQAFEQVAAALAETDVRHGRVLRWFVQLCGTGDFAGG